MCSSVEGKQKGLGKKEADDDDGDEDDVDDTGLCVDEEALIREKSPYEQPFIRDHRLLFSETLSPDRYLRCPPMRMKLKNKLSDKLDPSLYHLKFRNIPIHIKAKLKGL